MDGVNSARARDIEVSGSAKTGDAELEVPRPKRPDVT
jgi:hypothetical protein